MATVATVTYRYGSGSGPDNRQIDFIRTGLLGTLSARVSVVGQPTHVLGIIPETAISVEMESTTQKAQRMIAQQNNLLFAPPAPNQFLSQFPNTGAQDTVLTSINENSAASGGRWISITNGPMGAHGETVISLTITDPR